MNKGPSILIGVTIGRSLSFHDSLGETLAQKGATVHMVSSASEQRKVENDRIFFHSIEMQRDPSPLQDLISLFKWIQLVRCIRPDMVIAGTPKASFLGLLAARLCRVPSRIYFLHGLRLETTRGILRKILFGMEWLTFQNSTAALAVSDSLRNQILNLKLTSATKITVVGKGSTKGIDLNKFHPPTSPHEKNELRLSLGLDFGVPVIGFVGRLTAEKGIVEFKEALLSLKTHGADFQVLIIGAAEDTEGFELVNALQQAGIKVSSTGRVPDTSTFYRTMDIFCLPTYREGFGMVILEAFASGVPVVSTKVTGVIDLIEDGGTGISVEPRNNRELANAIALLLNNREIAEKVRTTASKFAAENFETKRVTDLQADYLWSQIDKR